MSSISLEIPRLASRLQKIYGDRADEALQLIGKAIDGALSPTDSRPDHWDQGDVVLITYGDQVRSHDRNPLQSLLKFLSDRSISELVSTVHFLPCFPYSSDDGFSVIDYRRVDENLGDWDDIHDFGSRFKLMLDFVCNHVSQQSDWFQNYLQGKSPHDRYFIEVDPNEDLSAVTRPRSLPLLSEFETSRGPRWLWTTFSRDQLDLNYAEPAVLAEVISILLEYADHGACIIRLDAIAYLWKQLGTNCIHLEETHEVVKLLREVLEAAAPQVLLLTETNVPHAENVSYFGDGDEAHMVYQFSLPPLLLDAMLNDDAVPLKNWVANLDSPPEGCTYFNFTASHDGIGVRPLEGQVDDARLAALVGKIKSRGGLIGTRRQADGSDSPYELNIAYVDAVADERGDPELHARRFLTTQAIMLALQGVPAIYFHSLVGTQNDLMGANESGIPRRINRRKFELDELEARIEAPDSLQQAIFAGMQHLLRARTNQPAFHPNADQRYIESGSDNVLCFLRSCRKSGQSILVAANFADKTERLRLPGDSAAANDLLESDVVPQDGEVHLEPAQVVWLEIRS